METYVYAFVIGGTLALIGQLLLRKWSFIRMMTIFVFIGMALESVGVYRFIQSFAHAGVETTLVHLGASCIQAVKRGTLQMSSFSFFSNLRCMDDRYCL